MVSLTLEQVRQISGQGTLVPIFKEINADLETPVSAYLKVARAPYSFLLESVEGGERIARYSFIGTEPDKVFKTGLGQDLGEVDPLVQVKRELDKHQIAPVANLERFNGGAVGYISYDSVKYFEPKLSPPIPDPLGLPESVFMLTTTFVIFDHLRHKIRVVSHVKLEGDLEENYTNAVLCIENIVSRLESPLDGKTSQMQGDVLGCPATSNVTPERYHQMVEQARQYIYDGENIQTVLSQRISRPTDVHPFQIYRALRGINPSPYMYYFEMDDFHVVGASPELLVSVENGIVSTHPIAGTRPRGMTDDEDVCLEEDLLADEKERAEHIMLVDLGRNDIGRVAKPGTVKVTKLMETERYSHVMHLTSCVTGSLKADQGSFDALRACFPAGTVSGAPKVRSMEIISELEPHQRGVYAGAVGYFDLTGNMDTAIAIRTLIIKDRVAYIQAGGGIVYDSTPEAEYEETLHKASALLGAIDEAENNMKSA